MSQTISVWEDALDTSWLLGMPGSLSWDPHGTDEEARLRENLQTQLVLCLTVQRVTTQP